MGAAALGENLLRVGSAGLNPELLAPIVQPKCVRKFDYLMSTDLLNEAIAADRLDLDGAGHVIASILDSTALV